MIRHQVLPVLLSICALSPFAGVAFAASVCDEVPADALGAVVVRDLSHADVAVGRLLRTLQIPLPQPLALVKAATGIDQGLNQDGDLLLAVLPGPAGDGRPQLAVWLPLGDYDRLVRSLRGVPRDRITAVTIAGEDVLMARHGNWAVVMDPDGRKRLEQVLDGPTSPAQPRVVPAAWNEWVKSNDVTAVLFQSGVGRVLSEVAGNGAAEAGATPEVAPEALDRQTEQDLFGFSIHDDLSNPWQGVRAAVREALSDLPEFNRRLLEASAVGCGLRLDADGNAAVGLRLAWPSGVTPEHPATAAEAAPLPYDGGPLVAAGAGTLSPAWMKAATGPYARLLAEDLGIDPHGQAAAIDALRKSLAAAADQVTAFALLSRPGTASDGVYTNSHLVLRVRSTKAFVDRAAAIVARWNDLAEHAPAEARLKFQSEPVQIAGHDGTQYFVDMADVVGGGALPEVRQSMERLFGPGGKLRVLVVPLRDRTVLVAMATDEQAAKVSELIARGGPARWDQEELQPTSRLLPADASWRMFISPPGYVAWLARQMDAILGPVLGGPLVKDFPDSPPLGIAGGPTSDGVWLELVAPAKTIEAFGRAAQ